MYYIKNKKGTQKEKTIQNQQERQPAKQIEGKINQQMLGVMVKHKSLQRENMGSNLRDEIIRRDNHKHQTPNIDSKTNMKDYQK